MAPPKAHKYSAKQYHTFKAKLKKAGKWKDNYRQTTLDDHIQETSAEFRDITEEEEAELAPLFEQAEQALQGKSFHMSYNDLSTICNLSSGDETITRECNSPSILETAKVNMQIQLENQQTCPTGQIHDSDLSLLHEGRDLLGKTRKIDRSHRIDPISSGTTGGGRTTGISQTEENLRDQALIFIPKTHPLKFCDFKIGRTFGDVNELEGYFQSFNSIGIVIKCLPDDDFNSYCVYQELCKHIEDPFILISEKSDQGVMHWHMIWLTHKRSDNARRLLQAYLANISTRFSLSLIHI